MQDYPRVPEMELVRRSDPYLTVSLRILVTRGDKTHMATTTRRFASALTALAVMGSGAQILAAPAQAGDNIDQKNDAKISCAEAQAAVDKAQADLKADKDNLAKLQENHKADKDKVEAARRSSTRSSLPSPTPRMLLTMPPLTSTSPSSRKPRTSLPCLLYTSPSPRDS